jgi:hypothetical protein
MADLFRYAQKDITELQVLGAKRLYSSTWNTDDLRYTSDIVFADLW